MNRRATVITEERDNIVFAFTGCDTQYHPVG